jgi:hypothetical protein
LTPVAGERPDDPEIEAIKKSGKRPREIRALVLAKLKERQLEAVRTKSPVGRRRKK